MSEFDICIIGAGIAGASLGWALLRAEPTLCVALLEAEDVPGRHTTGRSAAFFAELYGGPHIRPLSSASRGFFDSPPAGFADVPLLRPRGALHVCDIEPSDDFDLPGKNQLYGPAALEALAGDFVAGGVDHRRLRTEEVLMRLPHLRPNWATEAIWEPGCADIDVAALHAGYLRGARSMGAKLIVNAPLAVAHRDTRHWRIEAGAHRLTAVVLVNAAGAWADKVASAAGVQPAEIMPLRRTIAAAAVSPAAPANLPLVLDAGGKIYFKPDAGRLWISPHDESPDAAHDVQPADMDVAIALHRFGRMCDWTVDGVTAKWAGLRSFAPDRLPVLGWDEQAEGFFWCAGQGGWGIQTAPAAAELGAALLLGKQPALDPSSFDPARAGRNRRTPA